MKKAQAKLSIQPQLKPASVEYISDMCGADFVMILLRSCKHGVRSRYWLNVAT